MGTDERIVECDAYDELPYRSLPVAWTAPERLALCSMLHGGPRPQLEGYRVLEFGCGDGANLLPLACYRPHATFVGVDSSTHAIRLAETRRTECQLHNIRFIHADFRQVKRQLSPLFEFILVHGVFSWVSEPIRNELLSLCVSMLAPDGLLYINYNSKPGWNVRGMVRDFLRSDPTNQGNLTQRAQRAQEVAAYMAASLANLDHPYAKLMEQEYRFVCQGHPSYVAHEFLAAENHAYWRSEFLQLMQRSGLKYVADADFNYASGRIAEGLPERIAESGLQGRSLEDTVDLLSYRQLHSPVLTHASNSVVPLSEYEFSRLFLAASLQPSEEEESGTLVHRASGQEVLVKQQPLSEALLAAASQWPNAERINRLFSDVRPWIEDLKLLHRHGLIDLRATEPETLRVDPCLSAAEQRWGGYHTSPLHYCES